MSEPRLIVPCETCQKYDDIPCGHEATLADLLAVVRRGVESGTIKGQNIDWCETHKAIRMSGLDYCVVAHLGKADAEYRYCVVKAKLLLGEDQ